MKAKHVKGESLHGGPERSLCETVEVKPELCWRCQSCGVSPGRERGTKGVGGVKIDKCVVVRKTRM